MEFSDKVVVICPTYNRRYFLPCLIYQFSYQDYPKDLLHMIILDDSDIPNNDIFYNLNYDLKKRITYIHTKKHRTIGAKRNILNKLASVIKPKYIVCFDDDDYYPKDKISFGINMLKKHNYIIGGSSTMKIYDTKTKDLYTIGPFTNLYYGHASNGTLIYDIKYLENNRYNDNDKYGEERTFLNNFSVRLLQIPDEHVILCISHQKNTINKSIVIKSSKKLTLKLCDIIKDKYLLNFFSNV